MRKYEAKIPPGFRNGRLTEALTRLVQFYEETGQPHEAARWQTTFENTRVAPACKPGP
jgi:hypothetical protein